MAFEFDVEAHKEEIEEFKRVETEFFRYCRMHKIVSVIFRKRL